MIKNQKTIFENLKGVWSFNREIIDLNSNEINKATGKVIFTQINANKLHYLEEGQLLIVRNDAKLNFKREYLYELKEEQIHIILNDGLTKGDLFQKLFLSENNNMLGTEHMCNLDSHNGRYHFTNKHEFYTEFTIVGPKVNQVIKTTFSKSNNQSDENNEN
ncbi:MAG: DUF6314 family protein [Flavobacteriales bacterium]